MGKVIAVCISEKKGTVKKNAGSCRLIEDFGLEKDAHAGSERQVSLLSAEEVSAFRDRSKGAVELPPGIFGENLLVEGFDFKSYPIGTRFRCGEVLLELTQIGKRCHSGCEIMQRTGECIMPKEGVFARVLHGGVIRCGDILSLEGDEDTGSRMSEKAGTEALESEKNPSDSPHFSAAVLTASDRSFRGEREDKSGPKIAEMLTAAGYKVVSMHLLPDDEDGLAKELLRIADQEKPDVIFTTGGTGFSKRDRMPEATKRVIQRETPGISEAIRMHSMEITPRAMLSRAVSGIRGETLIVNLPGSPKAVQECLEFLLPPLEHGLGILRGEADG